MSTIADFFTLSSGSSGTKLARVTHGTTGYQYTVSCCSACCFCIPTPASGGLMWTYEMWGQGGGGGNTCCCMWGVYGGRGGDYGAARQQRPTGNFLALCYCGCACWCQSYDTGHCGQFSRICETNAVGWCMMTGGGCLGGSTSCNYAGGSSCNNCYIDCALHRPNGSASASLNPFVTNMNVTSYDDGNALPGGISNPYTCMNTLQSQTYAAAATGAAVSLCGNNDGIFRCSGASYSGCNCGTHTGHVYSCNPTETFSRSGSIGWACGSCTNFCTYWKGLGVGGGTYAGASNQLCHGAAQWAYCGCRGLFPGGGATDGGACGGGCCFGGIGGAGTIIISYDN